MNRNFVALLEEAQFTCQILGNGIHHLGKANYAQKGYYFSAFTLISNGLERIGKLCLILDHYFNNNSLFPEKDFFKNIGHDLLKLYGLSKKIKFDNQIEFQYLDNLNSDIHLSVLSILSSFSRGDRYSNIDLLVESEKSADPIKNWHENVDKILFEEKVSEKRKKKIKDNSELTESLLGSALLVYYIGESRKLIKTVKESSFLTGVYKATAKHRRLVVLQIIRYWVEILRGIQLRFYHYEGQEIPYLPEIFAIFNNDDSYLLTRKAFNR